MSKAKPTFSSSDPLVLAAVILSFKNNDKMNIRKIISAADYLDHSILTLKELKTALIKFQKYGILIITDSEIQFTKLGRKIRRKCLQIKKGRVPNADTLSAILNEIQFSPIESEKIYILKASEYKDAVREYLTE